jgi:DNA-3-methyladenine glycosylase
MRERVIKRNEGEGKLTESFYLRDDVVLIAQELLGMRLCTKMNGILTCGIINETEAYRGPEDRASHAYHNLRTERTEVMFHNGGICYVYLCYGIHRLLNVVTNREGIPHAVLIRGIEPLLGIEEMQKRRGKVKGALTKGPGCVASALGIGLEHNGISLRCDTIWIEKEKQSKGKIIASPRIGVDYAGEDAHLPWRFSLV